LSSRSRTAPSVLWPSFSSSVDGKLRLPSRRQRRGKRLGAYESQFWHPNLRDAKLNSEDIRPRNPADAHRPRPRGDRVKRRAFIALLGGAAAAWPLAARAQQPDHMRRIGVLMSTADDRDGQVRVAAKPQFFGLSHSSY